MSTHFWFGGDDTPYLVKKSTRFDDANLSRTPSDSDPYQYGETGEISSAITNTVTETTTENGIGVVTYTGNGTSQDITTGFSPDLVWIKGRESSVNHTLWDTLRGSPGNYERIESSTPVSSSSNANLGLTAFNSNGFTVVDNSDGNYQVNGSAGGANSGANGEYVAWCFNAGDTTVTNNEGTIESQVRSNGNFSIATYTGTSAVSSFGHGLSSTPSFVLVKSLNTSNNWVVQHVGTSSPADYLVLNSSQAQDGDSNIWNLPATSTVVNIGAGVNANGAADNYVAYCWAESPAQSFGSYTGDGSASGPVIECGFEPDFVLIKRTNGAGPWNMYDSTRSPSNPANALLDASSDGTESNNTNNNIDFLSTGFQLGTSTPELNGSGDTYIYAAFAAEVITETTSNTTTLQFNEPTSLDQDLKTELFAAGETVYQDSAYTATSDNVSAITVIGPEYKIANSLRFNGTDSYLNRTPSTAGDRRTFTFSYWIKESGKGTSPSNNPHVLWSGVDSATRGGFAHRGTDSDAGKIYLFNQIGTVADCGAVSVSTFNDFSTWNHIVWAVDTTNEVGTDRVKLYVNGAQGDLTFSTIPAQNLELQINAEQLHQIGRGTPDDYANGYMAELQFIDGLAVSPQEFGEYDSNGKWVAKEYVTSTSTSAITNVNTTATTTGPFAGIRTYDGAAGATYANATPYAISSGDTFNGTSNNVLLFDKEQLGSTWSLTFTRAGGSSENFQTYDSSTVSGSFSEVQNSNSGPITIDQDDTTYERFVLIYATGTGALNWTLTGTASVGTILTLTDDTNLDDIFVGDTVDNGSAADGKVIAVDSTGNTLTLTNVTGTWSNGETATKNIPYGTNGFHLPFDPAAVSSINQNPTNATWDPLLNDFLANPIASINSGAQYTAANGAPDKLFNFTNTPSGDWIIYCGNFASGNIWNNVIQVNGNNIPNNPTSDYGANPVYDNKYSFTGTLDSILVKGSVAGVQQSVLQLIIYNGEVWAPNLVINSIGVDDSGNGNNFHDQNFVTGNTSQVWSNSASGNASDSLTRMFDGNTDNGTTPTDLTGINWDIGEANKLTGQVELYLTNGVGQDWLTINGVANSLSAQGSASHNTWRILSGVTELWSFNASLKSDGSYGRISGIKVGGKLLVDGNIADTVVDSPTPYGSGSGLGGEVRGNYATLNPLHQTENYSQAFDMGNLRNLGGNNGAGGWGTSFSTIPYPSTGKWYYEATLKSDFDQVNNYQGCGFGTADSRYAYNQVMIIDFGNGVEYYPDSTTTDLFPANTVALNDTVGWAVDMDNWTYSIYINGVISVVSDRPIPFPQGTLLFPSATAYNLDYGYWIYNFGQQPFVNQAPTGFLALCTTNIAGQGG